MTTWTLDKAKETRFLTTSPTKSTWISLFQVHMDGILLRENGFLAAVAILSKVQVARRSFFWRSSTWLWGSRARIRD